MPFKWATPQRHGGHRLLDPIPLEIYFEIFSYIVPSDELSEDKYYQVWTRLSGVCRFFFSVSLAHAFRILSIAATPISPRQKSALALCRKLPGGDSLSCNVAQVVKECAFIGWSSEDPSEQSFHDDFMELRFRKALKRMPNLETVALEDCKISPALIKAISVLPSLTSLHISQCTVQETVEEDMLSMLPTITADLHAFTLVLSCTVVFPGQAPLPTSPFITTLLPHLTLTNVRVLKTNSEDVLDQFSRARIPLTELILLRINYNYTQDLTRFATLLKSFPTLTTLHIHVLAGVYPPWGNISDSPIFPLTFKDFPRLEYVKCPIAIGGAFFGEGSRLIKVDLTGNHYVDGDHIIETILPWDPRADELEELVLPDYSKFPCHESYPRLNTVVITCFKYPREHLYSIKNFIDVVASNVPSLSCITFRNDGDDFAEWLVDLDIQRDLFKLDIPTLRKINIDSALAWFRDTNNGTWRPRILNSQRMKRTLFKFKGKEVDWEGLKCAGL